MPEEPVRSIKFSEPVTLARLLMELSKFRETEPNIRVFKGLMLFDSELIELNPIFDLFEHLEENVQIVQEMHWKGHIILEIFL